MFIEQAIKKAIDGGWMIEGKKPGYLDSSYRGDELPLYISLGPEDAIDERFKSFSDERAFLDPFFWQALGNGMKWSQEVCWNCGTVRPGGACYFCTHLKNIGEAMKVISEWKYQWHRFIDHLAEGKTAESFFAEFSPKSLESVL